MAATSQDRGGRMGNDNWPSGSYRIFISYAREDATPLALRLRLDLNDAGQDAWLDTAEIEAGATWARDIEEAIENCDIVLALLSHASYISPTCRAEQARALRKRKRIIPILVQADADRPLELETSNYVDFCDMAHYDSAFADLARMIVSGHLPPEDSAAMLAASRPNLPPKSGGHTPAFGLKRDANGFRRYLNDLRGEPWLGERYWWTYFAFTYFDLPQAVEILEAGALKPQSQRARDGWEHTVRLYFRPRTPDLFGCEGVRPAAQRPANHCAVPVYLVFDMESVITLPLTRFSEGDINRRPRTFGSASAFRDLPFDRIYHDSWFSTPERDEVLSARRAQIIVPHALDLAAHLRYVWCRSAAEYQTLHHQLSPSARKRWGEYLTARDDYRLFHEQWLYVQDVTLSETGALFRFNQPHTAEGCGAFDIRMEIKTRSLIHEITLDDMRIEDDLSIDFTAFGLSEGYALRLYLDDTLVYEGRHIAPVR
ncbi:MAG: DUF4433 domain-containing protein [Anaerolineaceae bacterium]|nr:MAG: DUF4433 domain-containing protein [Anaerolineaceae bacterium]